LVVIGTTWPTAMLFAEHFAQQRQQTAEVLAGPREAAGDAEDGAPVEILLVEDNPGDARLMTEALSNSRAALHLNVVEDGVEAMAFLHRQDVYAQAPRPDLILLDLNLPRKDGREVLAEIRADSSLRRIPVVVLTTSEAQTDVRRAYELNANCYITKPSGLDQFVAVVKSIQYFWSAVATLPAD